MQIAVCFSGDISRLAPIFLFLFVYDEDVFVVNNT